MCKAKFGDAYFSCSRRRQCGEVLRKHRATLQATQDRRLLLLVYLVGEGGGVGGLRGRQFGQEEHEARIIELPGAWAQGCDAARWQRPRDIFGFIYTSMTPMEGQNTTRFPQQFVLADILKGARPSG